MKDTSMTKSELDMPIHRSKEAAQVYADAIGGGYIHRIFDYGPNDFKKEVIDKKTIITLKPGAVKRYMGYHVVPHSVEDAIIWQRKVAVNG